VDAAARALRALAERGDRPLNEAAPAAPAPSSRERRPIIGAALAAAAIAATAFVYGLWVGYSHGWAYHWARRLKAAATEEEAPRPYQRDRELLSLAFVEPMIAEQAYPPSTTLAEVSARVNAYLLDVARFPTAFADLEVGSLERRGAMALLSYRLGAEYTAHAYLARATVPEASCGALVIPGSGHDVGSAVLARDPEDAHFDVVGLALEQGCDVYVFVKPNEDFAAIHDGRRKLSYAAVSTYLLNKGGSYSAHYVANTLALEKYLQSRYARTVVLGLSQGGEAALLNAIQSRPTAAVVSSGYSVIDETLAWANAEQIIIPGYYRGFNEKVRSALALSPTRFLFTYGRGEVGTYRIEAEDRDTCRALSALAGVTCAVHPGKHVFPADEIRGFLATALGPRTQG
jgi:hypothetical protein